jgi:hypothetical protein
MNWIMKFPSTNYWWRMQLAQLRWDERIAEEVQLTANIVTSSYFVHHTERGMKTVCEVALWGGTAPAMPLSPGGAAHTCKAGTSTPAAGMSHVALWNRTCGPAPALLPSATSLCCLNKESWYACKKCLLDITAWLDSRLWPTDCTAVVAPAAYFRVCITHDVGRLNSATPWSQRAPRNCVSETNLHHPQGQLHAPSCRHGDTLDTHYGFWSKSMFVRWEPPRMYEKLLYA